MKKLKFLIALTIVALATNGVMAVTLPSTSYTPYSGGESYSNMMDDFGVISVNGGYESLGDGESKGTEWGNACAAQKATDPKILCSNCCAGYYTSCLGNYDYVTCGTFQSECLTVCDEHSLPLIGGEWFLLLIVVIAGCTNLIIKSYTVKKSDIL